jgi:hypothetical protein
MAKRAIDNNKIKDKQTSPISSKIHNLRKRHNVNYNEKQMVKRNIINVSKFLFNVFSKLIILIYYLWHNSLDFTGKKSTYSI